MSAATVATDVRERPILFRPEMVRAILAGAKTQTRRILSPQPEPFVQQTPDRHRPKHAQPYIDAYCGDRKTSANPRGMSTDWCWWTRDDRPSTSVGRCRYGVPGDRLWVREAWGTVQMHEIGQHVYRGERIPDHEQVTYRAGKQWGVPGTAPIEVRIEWGDDLKPERWRPSIHMPRWASRLTLEVAEVRVQRLQEISEDDARAEGAPVGEMLPGSVNGKPAQVMALDARLAFAWLWDSINLDRGYQRMKGTFSWKSNPWVWAITFKRLAQ